MLFVIDQRQYQAEVKRAEADLAKARSQVALWHSDVKRAQDLLASRALSQEEYDTRVAAERGGDATVQAAQAALDLARLNLEFTVVTSPIDGRAGQALVRAGNLVTAGAGGTGATLMTTVVAHGSGLRVLRRRRERLSQVRAARAHGHAPELARRAQSHPHGTLQRRGLSAPGLHGFRQQQARSADRHHPRARGVRQQGSPVHAGSVRAPATARAAAPTRRP